MTDIEPQSRFCTASVVKTIITQLLLFAGVIFVLWGAQKLYAMIDPVVFPDPAPVKYTEEMTDKEKGTELIDAITYRLRQELNSTFGWTPNDLLLNMGLMDNREYRQFGVYKATQALIEFYSMTIAKIGASSRENDNLYQARTNHFALSPTRFGVLMFPSAESSYKLGLESVEKYKKELESGVAVYNARPDDIHKAFQLMTSDKLLGFAIGLLQDSQDDNFYALDNKIYEVQGIVLVVRDFLNALYTLYPNVTNTGNADNFKAAMDYLDKICTYDPLFVTSTFNSPELVLSYLLFARNRIHDISDSIRI